MNNNLPEWLLKRLNDIADISGGSTPPTSNPEYWGGDIPFVTPTDITSLKNTNYIEKTERTITEKGLKAISNDMLKPGTILLTSRATLGEIAINKVPVVTNQGFANLKSKTGIDEMWLLYWLRSQKRELERLASGSTFKEVSRSSIKRMKVPVPPVVEQRGIAEVLGTVDEAIRLTDQVIERTETLKRGLMQRLLTQGIGHTEFKDTPLGKIPKTWKIMKISDVADTYSGGTPSRKRPDYYTGTIPWIKSGEINKEEIFETEEKITEEALKNSSAKMVNANTLLMAMYGATAGKVAITKIDASINQAIAAIIPKKILAVNPYLYYSLQFILNKVISHTQGSGQPNLSQTIINKIEIAVPPINEQIKISEIISSIDYKIKNNRNYRDKLNTIKQGLMQVLLSGEKRVELREDRLHRINNSGACL